MSLSAQVSLLVLAGGLPPAQGLVNLPRNKAAASWRTVLRSRLRLGKPSCQQYDFSAQRSLRRDELAPDVELALHPRRSAQLSPQCSAPARGRRDASLQRPRRRMSRDARKRYATIRQDYASPSARARKPQRADLRLRFRAAETGAARLHGAEGHGDGRRRLLPVITRRTQVRRVNRTRLRANAIEAAEQCGVLSVPEVDAEMDLPHFLAAFRRGRLLVFCDEDAALANPIEALGGCTAHEGVTVLIGPEGGFESVERAAIARSAQRREAFRSDRASFAPTPPPSRRWRSYRPRSAIGRGRRLETRQWTRCCHDKA